MAGEAKTLNLGMRDKNPSQGTRPKRPGAPKHLHIAQYRLACEGDNVISWIARSYLGVLHPLGAGISVSSWALQISV